MRLFRRKKPFCTVEFLDTDFDYRYERPGVQLRILKHTDDLWLYEGDTIELYDNTGMAFANLTITLGTDF